jgi:phage shock protein PspC (stress-responsive transcriptional regulator)
MEQTTPAGGDQPLPPAPAAGPSAPGDDGFFNAMRRTGLVRTQDRWVGGVAGGIARRFGIDPLLVRGILGVTVLLGGAGLVIYGLGWALLPEESDGRIHLQETIQGRFDAALLGAIAAVVIGFSRGDGWMGWWDDRGFGWVNGLLWAAAVAAVIAMVVVAANNRRRPGETSTTWAGAPGPAPAWSGTSGATTTWAAAPATSAAGPSGRGSTRAVPHPGYGPVPLAAPAGAGPVPPPPGAAPTGVGAAPPPPAPGAPGSGGGPGGWSGGTGGHPGHGGWPGGYAWTPPPPKPRVLGPGAGAVGAVVGLTLLVLAGLLMVDREGELGMPVGLTSLGIGVLLAGLAIIVSGLRGRSSGTLGFLAIVGIIAAVPVTVVTTEGDRLFFTDGDRASISSGSVWRPETAAEGSRPASATWRST